MKNAHQAFRTPLAFLHGAAALVAFALPLASEGAETDISKTPLIATSAALVKPNIMLLMDTSNSMARTHMPDEVESAVRPQGVGYKSSQCNAIYYNPAQAYFLPKKFDESLFTPPSFIAAPYSGYSAFYATPVPPGVNTGTTDLRSQFVAYDNATLEISPPAIPDTPQRAYYYVYKGSDGLAPATLGYAHPACRDVQPETPAAPLPFGATGGGTWTKVVVPADQEQNFANWYSFYRTRISLIKSAASLAFAPLNTTRRVGFITVQPKDSPTSTAINPLRYVPIKDFNTSQKSKWFSKVFSQLPAGASPAREGLARVGRYYGGREDGINSGMPTTGTDPADGLPNDPLQYACQQNFTILTTDGYWNAQTESTGSGGGGAVQLDGVTKVGQQDGDASVFYQMPPIWDGETSRTRVTTDKRNAYSSDICSLSLRYAETWQQQKSTRQVLKDTKTFDKHTYTHRITSQQKLAKTEQTKERRDQITRTTQQFVEHTDTPTIERYQHVRTQDRVRHTAVQYELQESQLAVQTLQTIRTRTHLDERKEQWNTATSQWVFEKSQYMEGRTHYTQKARQYYLYEWRRVQFDINGEHGEPVPDLCSDPTHCSDQVLEAARPVDPDYCLSRDALTPGFTLGAGNVRYECTVGSLSLALQNVASCYLGPTGTSPYVTPARAENNWVETTCTLVEDLPYAAIDGTCDVHATPTWQDNTPVPYTIHRCERPPLNNVRSGIATCAGVPIPPYEAPQWIRTTCNQPPGPTNEPAHPSPQCDENAPPAVSADYVITTCTKVLNSVTYNPSCSPVSSPLDPWVYVTCTSVPVPGDGDPLRFGDCVVGPGSVSGIAYRQTCDQNPAGPYATVTGIDTCSNGALLGDPGQFFESVCSNPLAHNFSGRFVPAPPSPQCVNSGPNSGNGWITSVCAATGANNDPGTYVDPASCGENPGTSDPYLQVTCTVVPVGTPTVVDPATCPLVGGPFVDPGNSYLRTYCTRQASSENTACAEAPSVANNWTVTICGTHSDSVPVASCAGSYPPNMTCDTPAGVNNATTYPSSCVDQPPTSGNEYVRVTCVPLHEIQPDTVIDPAFCPNGVAFVVTGANGIDGYWRTCATQAVAPYAVEQPVPWTTQCGLVAGVQTTCSFPSDTNFSAADPYPTADPLHCVPSGGASSPYIVRSCDTGDTHEFPAASCVAHGWDSNGLEVTCAESNPQTNVATDHCLVGELIGNDATVNCPTPITTGPVNYAGLCLPDPPTATNGYVETLCPPPVQTGSTADASCVPVPVNSLGVEIRCNVPAIQPVGTRYFVTETDREDTAHFSGTRQIGATSTVGPTVGPAIPYPDSSACYASPQTFTDQPPVTSPFSGSGYTCALNPDGTKAWPCFKDTEVPGGSRNSLADVAQYYYATDLRSGMINNVPSIGPGVEDDNAPWQHMTTFTLGLGVSGTLNYRPDYRNLSTREGDFFDIREGRLSWPKWPDPDLDQLTTCPANTYQCDPLLWNNPKSIDDFWHTAVDGRGRYFSASDPSSVVQGLGDALAGVSNRLAAGAAEGTSTFEPVDGNNFAYRTQYQSGSWTGDLQAFTIDPVTGVATGPIWKATERLGTKTYAACDNRSIYLIRGGNTRVDFTWESDTCSSGGVPTGSPTTALDATEKALIGAAQVALLTQYPFMTDGTGNTVDQKLAAKQDGTLVNFIRGQSRNEGFTTNSPTKFFRTRLGILGDLVDSQPVYVKVPFADYQDADYSQFKTDNLNRRAMVYVGGNDGMLHAFYATTDITDPLQSYYGQEAWAVIPSTVLPNLYKLADDSYKNDGHQFYVDGTPVVGDVYDASTLPARWKTVLVSGLNAGGAGYFALDVTDPTTPPKVLWEFKQDSGVCPATSADAVGNTADCDLGLSYGKPVITKLDGQWVVMITSGYNNLRASGTSVVGGGGYLYVLDAISGKIVHKVATLKSGTNVGTATTPSGLAQINNFVDNVLIDNTTRRVYGGDLLGNVWRFEFPPAVTTAVATLVGTVTDRASPGLPQPITVRPELAELEGKPFIMVGTGKFLGASDVDSLQPQALQKQSIYGFTDPLAPTGSQVYSDLRGVLRPLEMTTTGSGSAQVRTVKCPTSAGSACNRTVGWVVDLPDGGLQSSGQVFGAERVNVEMKLVQGTLVVATNVPEPVPCSAGGHSWFNYLDFRTGLAVSNAPTTVIGGVETRTVSQYLADTLNVGFNILKLKAASGNANGKYMGDFHQSNAETLKKDPPVADPFFAGKRISWREIPQ